jgi:hypothetical protein
MRRSPVLLCLALALGCAPQTAPEPPPEAAAVMVPEATDAPAPVTVARGYDGPVAPIAAPLDLGYGDASFRTKVTITVAGNADGEDRVNTLAVHHSGRLERVGGRVLGRLVTERIEIDGVPGANREALLVQDLVLGRKGELVEIATRAPLQSEAEDALPERYRALEQRWRERLPPFTAAPVAAGDPVYEDAHLLAPLRLMLQERTYEMREVRPLRAVAVGRVPCAGRECLLARLEGEAVLLAPRGALEVTTDGYELIDLATGLIVDGPGIVELRRGGAGQVLTMSIRTETSL